MLTGIKLPPLPVPILCLHIVVGFFGYILFLAVQVLLMLCYGS